MDKWNEIRTAYKLAKLRTLSATALDMGIHRSTVMRHIDALEEHLGVILFQRNDKGYIPTEAGLDIMRLGEVTENHFSQLSSRLKSKEQQLEGTITITSISEMAAMIMPVIKEYQSRYPKMRVDFIGDIRNLNLEYGEADIAIRSGGKPTTPDNVVLPFADIQLTLCAHKNYIEQYGLPTERDFTHHHYIALKSRPEHLTWNEWVHNHIPENNIVFLCSSQQVLTQAILNGCGIGVLPKQTVSDIDTLLEIPIHNEWSISTWILVHRDMFNIAKIKAFVDILREQKEFPIKVL
ncbi:LysR family transcriptional regulator [Photobacterium sp. OFAV2-7]|uniref:LysR family transcriptional regulator n=1 Tax=Photobacterium sp. OFAV2-7 TaxID=2917748 RepID=UPI001EF5C9E0|nr:LysR family transcriptional regulator [Photobacterium sp. OFAV2-7]MCG7587765.1 LysR family transcriptional regulator [Photobacterium sp. OFAV2-7]